MFKYSLSYTLINIAALSFVSVLSMTEASAQSNNSEFNQQQCIQNLVKEGLQPKQASVWCNYNAECIIQSQQEGLPLESAQTLCKCTISEFRNKYTTDKFKELTQQVNSNKKVARELREVGEMCFEKILYE